MYKHLQEYKTFIRYLMSICGHFQQTSVCLSVAVNKVGISLSSLSVLLGQHYV